MSHTSRWNGPAEKSKRRERSCCCIDQLLLLKKYAKSNEVQSEELIKENLKDQIWYTIG